MERFTWIYVLLMLSSVYSLEANSVQSNECGELGDCVTHTEDCDKKCGCDIYSTILTYNETTKECDVNVRLLLQNLTEKHHTHAKIVADAEKVFQGIMLSVVIFAACAGLCALSACFYCCRINYMDNRLKTDVDALSAKLKRENRYKKLTAKSKGTPQEAESCNIIVGNAGVYCV